MHLGDCVSWCSSCGRPSSSEGLAAALRAYLDHARRAEGLDFAVDDGLRSDPEPEMRAFLYGAAQEILMNVRKHAHASRVVVTLTDRDGSHLIRIRDDGIGFDVSEALSARPGHLGLAALSERLELAGGVLSIDSAPGAGATVELEVPAPALAREHPRGGAIRAVGW